MHKRIVSIFNANTFVYINNENRLVVNCNGIDVENPWLANMVKHIEFIEFSSANLYSALAKNNLFVEFNFNSPYEVKEKQLDCDAEIVSLSRFENETYFVSLDGRVFIEDYGFIESIANPGKRFVEVKTVNENVVVALLHAGKTVDVSKFSFGGVRYSSVNSDSIVAFSNQRFYSTNDYRVRISGLTVGQNSTADSAEIQKRIAILESRIEFCGRVIVKTLAGTTVLAFFVPIMGILLFFCFAIGTLAIIIAVSLDFLFNLKMIYKFLDLKESLESIVRKTSNVFINLLSAINQIEYLNASPIVEEAMRVHVLESRINTYESTRVISERIGTRVFFTNDVSRIIVFNTHPSEETVREFYYEHAQGIQSMVCSDSIAVMSYGDRSIRVNRVEPIISCRGWEVRLTQIGFIEPERVSFSNEMTIVL
jgi:hypothetical protein